MNRKCLLVVSVLCFALPIGTAAAAKDYSADRFDVDIAMQPDGSLLVTETVVFRFSGGPFTFVFRELLPDRSDGIADIAAALDGLTLLRGTHAGQVEIAGGDPIKVTWHFDPTSDATRTFTLSYRVLGAIEQAADADVLYWNVLPTDYEYPIRSSTIRITFPERARLMTAADVPAGRASIEADAKHVIYLARALQPNSSLAVRVRFEPGSLIGAPPQWQVRELEIARSAPVFVVVALVVFAAGAVGLLGYELRWRRSISAAARNDAHQTQPPADLPPALAGALASIGFTIQWSHALGTLFDLARRGVLRIEESPERKWYRQRDFIFRLEPLPPDLRPHERGLIAMLFEPKNGPQPSVRLSEVGSKLLAQLKSFSEPLQQEIEAMGWLDADRQRVRKQLTVAGIALMIAAFASGVGLVALAGSFGGWPLLIALALLGVGIVALVLGVSYSPLSDEGARFAAQWQSFAAYLRDVTRGREPLPSHLFETYLPYAASLGLAEAWAKAFKKEGVAEIPAWFSAVASSDGMAAFVAMTAASSSASGAAAGAAASAGGGGASGAG